ncbi:hypothetical protein ASPFODRAFT_177278 [Aspergillus luchuensis CBS 106.47]|uniref:HNH nuclease domain-containing protein n=1 Tax=Aspergillus luchuensis (strain CBS 106.47) TaxID=1137211 RepID=A0A1M3U0I6_ASPLC|nr:hypothetical protein ASPFODRAFT_177278 [Aspergillus luchuensis CBS 106.47]
MSTLTPNKIASRGPADELLDPERRKIIAQLSVYIGHQILPSTGWALLWFADLAILKEHLKYCGASRAGVEAHLLLKRAQKNQTLKELQRSASQISQETGELNSHTEPNKMAMSVSNPISKCRERDQNACILTGYREPLEVAHIFPYSLGQRKKTELDIFWENLQGYWSDEKIAKWKEQVLGPSGTETCSNLMCMSNLAHKLWETARFALNPLSISEDEKVLKVRFFWMPINKFSDAMSSRDVPSPFPDGCLSSIKVEGKLNAKLFNINTGKALRSGDVITFKTDDPVGLPLPSMELLNMQWALHRVLALSGAADATDEELDPPDPDWLQVEATDEDNEEEVESETEEDDPEEESWDEMVVESHRLNFPSCENRPASTLPRSRHDDHKDQEEQAEPADAESSPALGFRDTNIH